MRSLNEVADDVQRTMARKASFAAETFHRAHVVKLVPSEMFERRKSDEQQGFYLKIYLNLLAISRCILIPGFDLLFDIFLF